MIRRLPLLLAVLAVAAAATYVVARPMYHFGPDPSYTGAPSVAGVPAEATCANCHYVVDQNNLNAGNGYVRILDLPTAYVAGQTYTIRVELDCDSTRAATSRQWGFEMTAYTAADGQGAGTWSIASTDTFQIVTGFPSDPWASRTYVEHREMGTQQGVAGPVQWAVQWQAPAVPSGPIQFAVAGNATNGNFDTDGDWVFTAVESVADLTTPTRPVSWGGLKAQYRK